jgi:Uma2 family endonuclease
MCANSSFDAVDEKMMCICTADDLLDISARGDSRYELLHGKLRVFPFADAEHGDCTASLAAPLYFYVHENQLGITFAAGTGFLLETAPDHVRAPDIAFIQQVRLGQGLSGKYFPGAPDLAVEVVEQDDKASEVQDKIQDWLTHGTRLVWVVDPKSRTVTVYRPDGTANVLKPKDTLTGEDVLLGFAYPLTKLFGE